MHERSMPDGGQAEQDLGRMARAAAEEIARSLMLPPRAVSQIREEIMSHLYERAAQMIDEGVEPDAAMKDAVAGFGAANEIYDGFRKTYKEEWLLMSILENRVLIGVSLTLATAVCVISAATGIRNLASIPYGPTTWHDYSGPGFERIILGVPLAVLYICAAFEWAAHGRRPTGLVSGVAMLNVLLFLLMVVSTR